MQVSRPSVFVTKRFGHRMHTMCMPSPETNDCLYETITCHTVDFFFVVGKGRVLVLYCCIILIYIYVYVRVVMIGGSWSVSPSHFHVFLFSVVVVCVVTGMHCCCCCCIDLFSILFLSLLLPCDFNFAWPVREIEA